MSNETPEQRLAALGLTLPPVPQPELATVSSRTDNVIGALQASNSGNGNISVTSQGVGANTTFTVNGATNTANGGQVTLVNNTIGTGTLITVKGKPQGEPFKEPEFFNALMGIWLGNAPADWKLKDALLGKSGNAS